MELKDMTIEQLEERRAAIATEIDADGADLDALEEEARSIKEELEARKAEEARAAEAKKAEIRAKIAAGAGKVIEKGKKEERTEMNEKEIRNSKEYIDAFANYIKTGDDSECRALLTLNATGGQVPVPEYVEGRVRAAWERNGLMDLVTKSYIRGNLKIGFEISATGAVVHTEGAEAPAEETLTLGVVTLVPASIKKWIRISDEAYDLGGQEFIDYIYDELTYQIAKAASNLLISKIVAAPATSTATAVGVPSVAGDPSDLSVIAQATAQLADDSDDITVVMNRGSHPAFISAMVQANYLYDPFANVRVEYNNSLPVYADAEADATWMIVGDFRGAQANFPNGDEIRIKLDDLSEAEADLVKIVGREYVAIDVVKPGAFVKVTKNS